MADDNVRSPRAELSELVRTVATSMRAKLDAFDKRAALLSRPTIIKVPHDIRLNYGNAYDPKLISIGPYHHGKPMLQNMEDLKLLYLDDLLARSYYNNVELYAEAIAEREAEARGHYSASFAHFSSQEFVEMMVLDGCFIIEFLLKRAEGRIGKPLTNQVRSMPMLRHDLLLMENQIPFFVLNVILEKTEFEFNGSDGLILLDLALHYLQKGKILKEMLPQTHQEEDGKNIFHLLHLSYLCLMQGLVPPLYPTSVSLPSKNLLPIHFFEKPKDLIPLMIHGLLLLQKKTKKYTSLVLIFVLHFLVSCFKVLLLWKSPYSTNSSTNNKNYRKRPRRIPTVTELEESGVEFTRKENARCYLDVSFNKGSMELPLLHIQQNSISEFRNLLALEQACPKNVGNTFTSYVVLMDNLIDTAADVAALKRAGIIESKLGCNDDVARFFNGLSSGLCFDFDKHYLGDLFKDVNDYCNRDYNKWRAWLVHDYFHNPWAIFSLVGALILLGLTAAETAHTIKFLSHTTSYSPLINLTCYFYP